MGLSTRHIWSMKSRCSPARALDESPRIVWPIFPRHAANDVINSPIVHSRTNIRHGVRSHRRSNAFRLGPLVTLPNSAGIVEVIDLRRMAVKQGDSRHPERS